MSFNKIWRWLRPGEYLILVWIAIVSVIYSVYGQWGKFWNETIDFGPFIIPFLLTFSFYCVPLIGTLLKKLYASVVFILNPTREELVQDLIRFTEEKKYLTGTVTFLRDCLPVYLFIIFYPSTNLLLETLQGPRTLDAELVYLDHLIFRVHLSIWMESFISRGLTEVMAFFYSLHMILVAFVLCYLYFFAKRELFLEATQGFMLICMIGLTGYVLVPAVGPTFSLAHLYTRDLSMGFLAQTNYVITESLRVPRDCFPSLHVGYSALMLVYAWRANKWFGYFLLPLDVGNWISTIYLRYHYAIDVVAGLVLVPIVYFTVYWWAQKYSFLQPPSADSEPSDLDQRAISYQPQPINPLEQEGDSVKE